MKGAPDSVLPRCGLQASSASEAGNASEAAVAMSSRGLRVIAVAARPNEGPLPESAEEAESALGLIGLIGLQDPPRPEACDALAACRTAGIKVAMITGDHPRTAQSIAEEVGLRVGDAPVLVGADLPESDADLGTLVDHDGLIVARVDPETKLRIAKALQERGHVVGMTGDGVNDGPALREADIGIAMGASGSDVAREAADLVLLDDNFATIVAAVRQGRATFANARRFLTYHLTDNVAELTPFAIWALSGGRFPLALSVLQVLALDIGTDTFSAAALGAEPASDRVMHQAPVSGRLLNRTVAIRVRSPRAGRGDHGDGGVRGRAHGCRLEPRRQPSGHGRVDRGVGCGLPGGRFRAERERVRMPQRPAAGLAGAMALQPVPIRWSGGRTVPGRVHLRDPGRSRPARPGPAARRRMACRGRVGSDAADRRRTVEAVRHATAC
ncbi:MAG: HAD-IC family P-type ATPase [Microthrixaceae bacterium]|nr:HAD-IC family P-type ATPase [Microthrixaceae bacterium]